MRPALRLAWDHIRPHLAQLAIAVAVIAVSVALASSMLLANHALSESFERSMDALAGRADLQITAASGGSFDDGLVEHVRAIPGIGTSAPLLIGSAFVKGEARASVRVVGVDMLDDMSVRLYAVSDRSATAIEDPLVFLSQPNSAIVTRSFHDRHDLAVDGVLRLQTSDGSKDVVVRGLLDDSGVGRAFDGQLVVMDLESAQGVLGEERKVSQIDVAVPEGADVDRVKHMLEEKLPDFVVVERLAERKADLERTVAGFQLIMNAIAGFALILALLIMSNRLATVYEARVWEMGVMRALGISPGVLLRDLLVEALLLSAIGVALGVPLGWVLAQIIVAPVADAMALNFKQAIEAPWVPLRPAPVVVSMLAGLASGVLAGLVSAWRSTRLNIVDVLRNGRLRALRRDRAVKRRARWMVPALAVALLVLQIATGDGRFGAPAMVALACAAGLLVQPALRTLTRPLHASFGSAAGIGLQDQSLVPSRAIAAGGVLLGGIAVVVWMANTSRNFESFVVDGLMATRRGDLVVDSAYNLTAVGAGETKLAEDVLTELAAIPGVRAVGAVVNDLSEQSELGILAIDAQRMLDPAFGTWKVEGGDDAAALRRVAAGEALFGNAQLATSAKVGVGDVVPIVTPTGVLELPLAGIVNTSFLSQKGDVVISRALYQRHWRRSEFNEAQLVLAADADPADVAREVRHRLGDAYNLRVRSSEELANWFADSVRQGFAVNDVMMLITLLVVLFGSGDALAANVAERAKEIGVLRALGLSRGDVTGMVLVQALAIGMAGAVLGILLGLGLSLAFVGGVIRVALGWSVRFEPTYAVPLLVGALGVCACLLGAALPALRAGRLSTITVLRYE